MTRLVGPSRGSISNSPVILSPESGLGPSLPDHVSGNALRLADEDAKLKAEEDSAKAAAELKKLRPGTPATSELQPPKHINTSNDPAFAFGFLPKTRG